MAQLEALFADYASHHRTRGNKLFHRVGIPLIVLTAIGMLARVGFVAGSHRFDAAMLVIALSTVCYLWLDWRLGSLMLLVSVACYFLGAAMPMWLDVTLFVLGWIFQFIGHSVYEKRNPAFFRNFVHLLVGPLWILNDAIPVARMKSER